MDRSRAAVVAVCLATAVAACGSHPVETKFQGVGSTVVFGSHQALSGPASPGYREISGASADFFSYVNDHGGVYGRTLRMITMNDAYDPTHALSDVQQLVLYNDVFGIFEGLGTAAHSQVKPFLNAYQVPDLFVASPCPCWTDGNADPFTYGWQPTGTVEGKILGWYIHRHFPGQKVGVLYQDDEAGRSGLAGIRDEVPQVVAHQPYRAGATTLTRQLRAIKKSGATVLVDFTLPTYTALGQLTSLKIGYSPHLAVWSGGADPVTVARMINVLSAGAFHGYGLIEDAITDTYLPPITDTSNPWIRLFRRIEHKYAPGRLFDSNIEYGLASAYTVVQALRAAGANLTRQGLINAINRKGSSWRGPGLVPLHYSRSDHAGYSGAQLGHIRSGRLAVFGTPMVTTTRAHSPVTPYRGHQSPPPPNGFPGATSG
ncbi:MAG: ABC transporter substrate-binding protein [Solirubrobacteraceae bacterium]